MSRPVPLDPATIPNPVAGVLPNGHDGPDGHDGTIVTTRGLTKHYGDFEALSDCSIEVNQGEVFGLLGPNGAGKTTLIRLLLGHLKATSGKATVSGFDPSTQDVAVRGQLAYLPADAHMPPHLRGKRVLEFFAGMHPAGNLERSLVVAERLELDIRRPVAMMSTGMRQKLALAVVFGVAAPLLILDEPTANLDPTVRAVVLELAMEARQRGTTVMLSSHVMSEIEETCDRVVFLRQGKLAHQLEMSDLFQRHRITSSFNTLPIEVPNSLRHRVRVSTIERPEGKRTCIDTDGDLAPLMPWLASLELNQVRIEPLGLRTIYDAIHRGEEPPQ